MNFFWYKTVNHNLAPSDLKQGDYGLTNNFHFEVLIQKLNISCALRKAKYYFRNAKMGAKYAQFSPSPSPSILEAFWNPCKVSSEQQLHL